MARNHYQILGVSPDVDEKEIRSAYRNLAKRYHPDAGQGSSAAEFRAVQSAYDVLSDPTKRREYDRQRVASRVEPLLRPFYAADRGERANHLDLRHLGRSAVAEPIRSQADDPFEWYDRFLRRVLEGFFS